MDHGSTVSWEHFGFHTGYATGVAGKWHLNRKPAYGDGDDLWLPTASAYDAQVAGAAEAGFDWAGGFYVTNLGDADSPLPFSHNVEWVIAEAEAFVAAQWKPWFLYCNPTPPHSPDAGDALANFTARDTPAGVLASDPELTLPIDRAALAAAALAAEPRNAAAREAMLAATWVNASVEIKMFRIRSTWSNRNEFGESDRPDLEISCRDDHRSKNEPKRPRFERARRVSRFVSPV